jgi:hypothetical protein
MGKIAYTGTTMAECARDNFAHWDRLYQKFTRIDERKYNNAREYEHWPEGLQSEYDAFHQQFMRIFVHREAFRALMDRYSVNT